MSFRESLTDKMILAKKEKTSKLNRTSMGKLFKKLVVKKEAYVAKDMKKVRRSIKLSLRELSEMTGYSRSYLSAIELGKQTASLDVVEAIEKALSK